MKLFVRIGVTILTTVLLICCTSPLEDEMKVLVVVMYPGVKGEPSRGPHSYFDHPIHYSYTSTNGEDVLVKINGVVSKSSGDFRLTRDSVLLEVSTVPR